MKKQYIKPVTLILEMNMQHHVMTGSGVQTNSDGDVETVGIGGEYDGNGFKSRGNDWGKVWDDEEEEEEEKY